jgi:uroporphyrinogen-III decarboxylase
MARAKKELAGVACIAGNFRYQTLARGSKQQVVEEAKRLLDICAPGGGYMFDLDGGMCSLPRENIEALYETVKEYGKY